MVLFSKKGISQWISWVMITGLAVVIGTAIMQWSRDRTVSTVDDITQKADVLTFCQETGLSVTGYCQDTQTLNMNVTNNNNRKIDGVIARGFDIYNNPQFGDKNVTLVPEKPKNIVIVKQGVLKRAEVMPTILVGGKRVVCQSRKIDLESIGFCN